MKHLLLILFMLLLNTHIQAQTAPPLLGDILAMNTVQQDAIILYDLATDSYRTISYGAGAHHVWDFSADGCRVLFTYADGSSAGRLYSMNIDGSSVREMAVYPDLPFARLSNE